VLRLLVVVDLSVVPVLELGTRAPSFRVLVQVASQVA